MRVTKAVEFDAGHRVPLHGGQCRFVHGHRYRVAATMGGVQRADGMVVDFAVVKEALAKVVAGWDHAFLSQLGDPIGEALHEAGQRVVWFTSAPTAETLAEHVGAALSRDGGLDAAGLDVEEVTVWETPSSWVSWRP